MSFKTNRRPMTPRPYYSPPPQKERHDLPVHVICDRLDMVRNVIWNQSDGMGWLKSKLMEALDEAMWRLK